MTLQSTSLIHNTIYLSVSKGIYIKEQILFIVEMVKKETKGENSFSNVLYGKRVIIK